MTSPIKLKIFCFGEGLLISMPLSFCKPFSIAITGRKVKNYEELSVKWLKKPAQGKEAF